MSTTTDPRQPAAAPPALLATSPGERRRAVASSFIGSTVEYYDFLLYAAAAGLVFPKVFFAQLDTGLATTLSFVVLLVGYLSRPIGGLLFGHFGDRFGRKNVLIVTLVVMGLCSAGIGLLPTYAAIGAAAPILLVVLRTVQGLAVGGEWAGATLMAMEHSHSKGRAFSAALASAGGPMGAVLSTFVLAIFSALSGDAFMTVEGRWMVDDWGWRVPFLLSSALVLFGFYLRSNLKESPDFEAARAAGEVHTGIPLLELFRTSGKDVILGVVAVAGSLAMQGLLAVFMVPYVVKNTQGAISRAEALMMFTVSEVFHVFAIPFFAWCSDRLGRKLVMISGSIFGMVALWPMFKMFDSSNPTTIGFAFLLGNAIIQAFMYGPVGAFLAEKFPPAQRYTGVSFTYQVGSVLGAGIIPLVANRLVNAEVGTSNLAIYLTVVIGISAVAVWLSRETRHDQSHAERFVETAVIS